MSVVVLYQGMQCIFTRNLFTYCCSSGFSRSLVAACTDNDVNTVKRLLCKGNVNLNDAAASTDDGESLLSMACSAGYYELAQVCFGI